MLSTFDVSQLLGNTIVSPYLAKAVMILVVLTVVRVAIWLLSRHLQKRSNQVSGRSLTRLSIVAPSMIWVTGIALIFVIFGLDLNSITEILIAGGLVIGLVVTPAGSNAIAGFLNIWNDVFHVGETLGLEDDKIIGVVTHCGVMSVRLKTIDGSFFDVPNKMLFDQIVHNFTRVPFYRIKVYVHVDDPSSNPQKVKQTLEPVVRENPCWNKSNPETGEEFRAEIRFHEIGPSSDIYLCIGWITDRLMAEKMQALLLEECVRALHEAGVSTGQTTNLSAVDGLHLLNMNSYASPQTYQASLLAQ